MKRILATLAVLALSACAVLAHDFTLGDLKIHHPASRATLPGQPVGGGFMTITNTGAAADRLVSIAAPDVSDDVQIHEMAMENDVMKMRQLADGVELPAGATVELKSGGLHVMFMKIKHPLKEGDKFKATLTFEKAGKIDVDFKVEAAKPAAKEGEAAAGDHSGHGG
ncbi:copper chaperone PCu(A)C [Shinella zoogloeoides]|uniref:Copper chaperone PCu(A)C n=1 Tax=Shinella zoogloeoides TaxID=352475 RepID=A0A6N8TA47_SHIZO|nr:copper chaperone PCu(A)C [Shinella zoogloeoides]MXO00152.1 copper chaperone PCu(A)C [Shinella zoogloeoides]UEX82483.1 copper chaperone PCu(A)C [Shinella zoogloeoides]